MSISPHAVTRAFMRGQSLQEEGDIDGAIAAYDQVIVAVPVMGLAYGKRGLAHMQRGDMTSALFDLDAAIGFLPDDAPDQWFSRLNRISVLLERGDVGLAGAAYARLHELGCTIEHPEDARLRAAPPIDREDLAQERNARAKALCMDKVLIGAVARFREANDLKSGWCEARHGLGIAFGTLRLFETAIAEFSAVLADGASPSWMRAEALMNRGEMRMQLGHLQSAFDDKTQALELCRDPRVPYPHENVAAALMDKMERDLVTLRAGIDKAGRKPWWKVWSR